MSMQALLSASQSMARMQTMQSARTQMQGKANVLRIESKQDGGNENKDMKADELEENSGNLMEDLMEEVTDVNETIKSDEEIKAEEKQEEKSTDKGQRADTVTISDSAAGYRGALPEIHPAMGEAVTYDAGGSKVPGELEKTAPVFEATA